MVYRDASRLICRLVISTTRTPIPFGGFAQGVGLIDRILSFQHHVGGKLPREWKLANIDKR